MKTNERGQFVKVPVEERFWDKVNKNGPPHPSKPELGKCWLWTGALHEFGYGVIWTSDHTKRLRAHRVAWELINGKIPEGKHLLHSCDRPRCVNPAHTYPGTAADNSKDMVQRGRGPLGEKNGMSRLTTKQVLDIRKNFPLRKGKTGPRNAVDTEILDRLCKRHHISKSLLARIAYCERWKHV